MTCTLPPPPLPLRDGYGGFPFDLHFAVEKDKASTCLQGESHLSVVHCVPPFGHRHITQVWGGGGHGRWGRYGGRSGTQVPPSLPLPLAFMA